MDNDQMLGNWNTFVSDCISKSIDIESNKFVNRKLDIKEIDYNINYDVKFLLHILDKYTTNELPLLMQKLFVDTLINRCQNYDFSLLLNNLPTVKIKVHSGLWDKLFFNNSLGNYDIKKNQVAIKNQQVFLVAILHELLHMASSYYDKSRNIKISGFFQANQGYLGYGINEGFTQYLMKKYFPDYVLPNLSTYQNEVKVFDVITKINDSNLEQLYFSANILKLISALEKYASPESVKKLIFACDNYTIKQKHASNANFSYSICYLEIINEVLIEMTINKYNYLNSNEIMQKINDNYNISPVSINNYEVYNETRYMDIGELVCKKVLKK